MVYHALRLFTKAEKHAIEIQLVISRCNTNISLFYIIQLEYVQYSNPTPLRTCVNEFPFKYFVHKSL